MHADSQVHDRSRDPILDGRDSFRLVKLRLALTLVAVAILPIAAVSPLVRAVADEAGEAHRQRLEDQALVAVQAIGREIGLVQSAAARLVADPILAEVASEGAGAAAQRKAANRLGDLVDRPGGTVVGVVLLSGGVPRAAAGGAIDLDSAAPGLAVGGLAVDRRGEARLLLVEPGAASDEPRRMVVVALSIAALLDAASPSVEMAGRDLLLVDGSGRLLAEVSSPFDPGEVPGEVLAMASLGNSSSGRATVELPDGLNWQVVVSAPIPLVGMPVETLAALAGILLVLVAFTVWMARQILRPAAQLEASRSRLRELYESAHEAAIRDSLTGLGNHRAFQEAVARMVEGARRYGTAFSLVLIDVDEFKRVNDTRGHAVGDQLLAEVGDLISATIRLTDAAFRVGGDEFALLLPHTDASGASVVARRLLARGLDERSGGRYRAPISFSAGVTACPEFGLTRLELTAQADAALYRGKRTGRTVVTLYDPEKDHGHVDEGMRAELSSAISAVIERGSLTPVYQPIVELASGRVVGYEGLVRVPRESTFAHTGALFDAAEIAGRVSDLDRAALDVVLRGAHAMDESVTLSVNVSPRTLEAPEFSAATFLSILRRHGMPPGRVVMELTERESIRDAARLRAVLSGLQGAGVRVAADDVGAGNAGLQLLSQFRFDIVKIDLSLVQRAGDDQTHSVLRSIVEVAERMGARTIAEGVETSAQLRTSRRLGITAGQGYLLGRPGPERDLTWVDIAALEQRDEVAVPVGAEPSPPRTLAARVGAFPDPNAGQEPVLVGASLTDSGRIAAVRRRSLAMLRTSRQASD